MNVNVFATYDDLRKFGASPEAQSITRSASFSSGDKDTFLSHSSKDNHLLPGVIVILQKHGANVYVDNADETLPQNPSVETAEILRGNLRSTKKFILFVTLNSKDSIWIPWELGIADGEKRPPNVALFPSAQDQNQKTWSEQEYLGLYRRIVWANFRGEEKAQWLVYDHHENTATRLSEWIKQ